MAHGGNPWALLEEIRLDSRFRGNDQGSVLDFSADVNPLGPPEGWRQRAAAALGGIQSYPEPTYRSFREAAARFEGVEPECILAGNGTADLIHLISRSSAGAPVTVAVPTFTEYERAAAADRSPLLLWALREEEGFSPESLGAPPPTRKGGLLFLCNPNNPTGGIWPAAQLRAVLRACAQTRTAVVIDEAYMELVADGARCSAVPWLGEFPHLIVLRSMTKSFSVPALRLGYLVASPERVRALQRIQPPWPMNGPAAALGEWLFEEKEYLARSRRFIETARRSMEKQLRELGVLHPVPSAANFLLCRLQAAGWSDEKLARAMGARGLILRACGDFTGLESGGFIRVAVRRPEENARLLENLREVFFK